MKKKKAYSSFNKLNISRNILALVGLIMIFHSCKEEYNDSDKILIWENFKTKIENNDYEYLIENSTDSIKCVDCISGENELKIPKETIYKNYIGKLYDSKILDKKEYSIYSDNRIIRISYTFKTLSGNESTNIIYMFDKVDNRYLFTGMITIP